MHLLFSLTLLLYSIGLDISNDPDLLECFLNLPLPDVAETNPDNFAWIHAQKNTGTELATKAAKYPDQYFNKIIDGGIIVCHALPDENHLTQWKIALTKEVVISLIKWYYCILAHPGWKRSRITIQARYYHTDIRKHVNIFHCDFCQLVKLPHKGMGLLPECNFTNTPWYEVVINLIGPWTAKTDQFSGAFYALTCIDTTTNLLERVHIDTKSSDAIARKLLLA